MTKTENQILNDIKTGQFSPVYLISGEEDYFIDLVSDAFESGVVSPEAQAFDQSVVYGRDTSLRAVVDIARQYPLMGERRLVLVKEAQDIRKAPRDNASSGTETTSGDRATDNDWADLGAYLRQPMPSTVLVFCYRHGKFDKRRKIYRDISTCGVVCEHKEVRESDLPAWIFDQVSQAGFQIDERTVGLLIAMLGKSMSKLSNELSKLFIALPRGSRITSEVVERNIGISKDYNIFELQSAIGRRDVARCNTIVCYFADNPKQAPLQPLLAGLYSYFIRIMLYHQAPDKTPSAVAQVLGVNPYFVRDYEQAARNYSLGKLASCIGYLYDVDLRAKGIRGDTGVTPEGELLKELIFKITH